MSGFLYVYRATLGNGGMSRITSGNVSDAIFRRVMC